MFKGIGKKIDRGKNGERGEMYMNVETFLKAIKLNNQFNCIKNLYDKYCVVNRIEKLAIICSKDEFNKDNNLISLCEASSTLGYGLVKCSNYDEFVIAMENMKKQINNELNSYLAKELFDQETDRIVKSLFGIE